MSTVVLNCVRIEQLVQVKDVLLLVQYSSAPGIKYDDTITTLRTVVPVRSQTKCISAHIH